MPNVFDLNEADQPLTRTADVCVIGAGAAGLYLAARLSRAGCRVVSVEAGPWKAASAEKVGIDVAFGENRYAGAVEGRAFGWGGTTARWGGLLAVHSDLDFRQGEGPEAAAWEAIVAAARRHSETVFSQLGLGREVDFEALPAGCRQSAVEALRRQGYETVATEFLPFQRRNLTYLLPEGRGAKAEVFLNAMVCRWTVSAGEGAAVIAVEARSLSGRALHVSAQHFVIAAGAIESTRMVLELNRSAGGALLPHTAKTGHYLSDHLSCSIADVAPEDRTGAAKIYGPIFVRGRMRSFRFIERTLDPLLPRHFAHFIFAIENAGFDFARAMLSSLQSRSMPRVSLGQVTNAASGLAQLGYDRFMRARLFIAVGTPAHLQLDVEQQPTWQNRISLGDDLDRYGRPSAIIHWSIRSADYDRIEELSRRFLVGWPERDAGLPELVPSSHGDAGIKPYDAYHPVGTCRMGTDAEATVDLNLRVKGTSNLHLLSTAVFPSAGTANPTFSMLCLGEELAATLIESNGR